MPPLLLPLLLCCVFELGHSTVRRLPEDHPAPDHGCAAPSRAHHPPPLPRPRPRHLPSAPPASCLNPLQLDARESARPSAPLALPQAMLWSKWESGKLVGSITLPTLFLSSQQDEIVPAVQVPALPAGFLTLPPPAARPPTTRPRKPLNAVVVTRPDEAALGHPHRDCRAKGEPAQRPFTALAAMQTLSSSDTTALQLFQYILFHNSKSHNNKPNT